MTCEPCKPIKHAGGRPREWDRDSVLLDLLDWAHKQDSINLNQFCGSRLLPPQHLSKWALECTQFRESYWVIKTLLGARREAWLSSERLHQKAYHLSHHTYDYFTREEDRDYYTFQKELDAKIGKEVASTANEDVKSRLDATLAQLSELQSSLNKAKSKINKEEKS
jgi:hypothetical protein